MCKKIIGKKGEELATKYLTNKGIKVIKQNFYCKFGEIDIIAKDGEELVFVEVKTRTNSKFGKPAEAVNYNKKKHLYHSIECYLYLNNVSNTKIRIDVIEIYLDCKGNVINHIKNICL